jgi:hypothetical protein
VIRGEKVCGDVRMFRSKISIIPRIFCHENVGQHPKQSKTFFEPLKTASKTFSARRVSADLISEPTHKRDTLLFSEADESH